MEFGFRIIVCSNGTEIIDRNKTTSYSELTPLEFAEYTEMDVQLFLMDRMDVWQGKKWNVDGNLLEIRCIESLCCVDWFRGKWDKSWI